jgi:hypothetical protein
MPSECASIGDNPGPTDHLYNAGSEASTGSAVSTDSLYLWERLGDSHSNELLDQGLR